MLSSPLPVRPDPVAAVPAGTAEPSPSVPDTRDSLTPCFSAVDFQELRTAAEVRAGWLWHGYLAPGNVTLLTSR
jgi:hypothetical protein